MCVEPNVPGHFLVRAQLSVMTGRAIVLVSLALRIPRPIYIHSGPRIPVSWVRQWPCGDRHRNTMAVQMAELLI